MIDGRWEFYMHILQDNRWSVRIFCAHRAISSNEMKSAWTDHIVCGENYLIYKYE